MLVLTSPSIHATSIEIHIRIHQCSILLFTFWVLVVAKPSSCNLSISLGTYMVSCTSIFWTWFAWVTLDFEGIPSFWLYLSWMVLVGEDPSFVIGSVIVGDGSTLMLLTRNQIGWYRLRIQIRRHSLGRTGNAYRRYDLPEFASPFLTT